MELYILGPAKTLAVEDVSVGFVATDMKPTSGFYADMQVETVTIRAIGELYVEAGGGAATTGSFPLNAGDSQEFEGYQNIKNLRFIRNAVNTTLVWIPGYR